MIPRIFTLLVLSAGVLNAQVTTDELSRSIRIENLKHPYLFFTNDEKKALLERVKTDEECRNIMAAVVAEGHRFLNMPIRNPAPESPKHSRYYVEDDEAANYAADLVEGARTLAFLFQMTGEDAYVRKAYELAVEICNMEDWVNPAHKFDIIYPRVWPRNVPDDQVVFSFDISAAGRAIALSTVYDWLYPALSGSERDKIRNALLEKAITRVRGNYEFFWWSTAYRCNWSAICYAGLGVTALSLMKENPQIIDVAAEAYNRINLTFDQIGDDGGWQEGRGYYAYMMRESVFFMEALKRLSGGRYNLFHHPHIQHRPLDFLLFTLTSNFEDSEGFPVGSAHVVDKLVEETGNPTGAWYRNSYIRSTADIFEILWPKGRVQPMEPEQKSRVFKSIHWAMLRGGIEDSSTVTIACKAGYNDDPHHGHLDCGQFSLTWYGAPFIRDLGRMRYDEFYFNEDRWQYPHASSAGHNLVFVNGEEQIPAKRKNQPWKQGIGGTILQFRTGSARDYVLMDPSGAYPGKELKKWRRHIILEKPSTTLILDEVDAASGSMIAVRFFPGGSMAATRSARESRFPPRPPVEHMVSGNYVVLSSQRHGLALIPLVVNNAFTVRENSLPFVPVTENAVLTWIPYFETVVKAHSARSIIATIIVPVDDGAEAEKRVASAVLRFVNPHELQVGVDAQDGRYVWSFVEEKDGLVLAE